MQPPEIYLLAASCTPLEAAWFATHFHHDIESFYQDRDEVFAILGFRCKECNQMFITGELDNNRHAV